MNIFITFYLVAEGEIPQTLKGLGFVEGKNYLPSNLWKFPPNQTTFQGMTTYRRSGDLRPRHNLLP